MRVMIVDDEPLARDRLRALLPHCGNYTLCGEASNGKEAVRKATESHPDIVLMDIRMPGSDGLDAAHILSEMEDAPAVVFITAYDQHAISAFEARAMDYLLKPVSRERLQEALAKARRLTRPQRAAAYQVTEKTGGRRHLCARSRGRMQLVPIEEVYYLQADHKYVTVRHEGGEILIEEPLKALEEEFPNRFLRIHRNALVSRAHIAGLERNLRGRLKLSFKNIDDQLDVSRRHAAKVREAVKQL
ncbi:LytR/AlgR family response regulator transcription factor [Acidihalobacter prosperus]